MTQEEVLAYLESGLSPQKRGAITRKTRGKKRTTRRKAAGKKRKTAGKRKSATGRRKVGKRRVAKRKTGKRKSATGKRIGRRRGSMSTNSYAKLMATLRRKRAARRAMGSALGYPTLSYQPQAAPAMLGFGIGRGGGPRISYQPQAAPAMMGYGMCNSAGYAIGNANTISYQPQAAPFGLLQFGKGRKTTKSRKTAVRRRPRLGAIARKNGVYYVYEFLPGTNRMGWMNFHKFRCGLRPRRANGRGMKRAKLPSLRKFSCKKVARRRPRGSLGVRRRRVSNQFGMCSSQLGF